MTTEKKSPSSGLRSIATLQTIARSAKPQERHQLANRYARLENERARLEREVGIWEGRRQTSADKMAKVREEIDTLRPLLDEKAGKKSVRQHRSDPRRKAILPDVHVSPNRTMQLDY